MFIQALNNASFLPRIGTGDEIRAQYQQLAQVKFIKSHRYLKTLVSVFKFGPYFTLYLIGECVHLKYIHCLSDDIIL